jgi:predicted Zn-dependent protease
VEDIGVRAISEDQEKDIKLGEDALREMKLHGLFPPELESKEVKAYVQGISDRIAANSDVKVPVKLTVLHSEEINAFALPGGFLFVNTGLLDRARSESELAGVIAHELAHVSARHGAKLMRRANIANIMYQMAQIAIIVGTGGYGTIGTYYLFQAGFLGLGLVLDLSLLGVSREFEAEADQLGAQYAWKAGYDPRGFISFFDTMAAEKGYIRSASFFRTHPPYFERIVATLSEIEYLPTSGDLTVDSSTFRAFKAQLADVLRQEVEHQKDAPTLRREPPCDDLEDPISGME